MAWDEIAYFQIGDNPWENFLLLVLLEDMQVQKIKEKNNLRSWENVKENLQLL